MLIGMPINWISLSLLVRMKHGTATLKIILTIKHRVTYDPAITLLGIYPREMKT